MRLSKFLRAELIEPDLILTEKDEVLEHLVQLAMPCIKTECAAEGTQVLTALREREGVTSTGIGNGVAIPHAKVEGLSRMSLVFAKSTRGVNFQALDDAPVYLIFMVIAPPSTISDYLKLLAAISAFVKNEKSRAALMRAGTKAEILAAIKAGEAS